MTWLEHNVSGDSGTLLVSLLIRLPFAGEHVLRQEIEQLQQLKQSQGVFLSGKVFSNVTSNNTYIKTCLFWLVWKYYFNNWSSEILLFRHCVLVQFIRTNVFTSDRCRSRCPLDHYMNRSLSIILALVLCCQIQIWRIIGLPMIGTSSSRLRFPFFLSRDELFTRQ